MVEDLLCFLTVWTIRAKPRHIRPTHHPPHMPSLAIRTQHTEPAIIIRAFHPPIPHMVVQALSAKLALTLLQEPDTHGHRPQVEIMRVLAVIAHLAEVPQVMFAYCCFLFALAGVLREGIGWFEVQVGRGGMSVGALGRWQGTAKGEKGESADLVVWIVSAAQGIEL